MPSFDGEYQSFFDFGRIVRNADGYLKKIVEKKDATPEELLIKELNTAVFCFKADWLWEHLKQVKNKTMPENARQDLVDDLLTEFGL